MVKCRENARMLAKDRLDGTYVCGPAVAVKTMLACGAGVLGCVFAR